MKTLLTVLFTAGLCLAQSADDSAPSSTNRPGAAYPRVRQDMRVTFRLAAPGARKVQLVPGGNDNGLGAGPFDMKSDEKGNWSVTTPPAVPGFHYYWFSVDGLTVNDPNTFSYFGWNRECSGVEVPDAKLDFYSVRAVPHGEVRQHWYFAKTTGAWRRAFVYTPPGYDQNPKTRYPVLYLQHGSGESERGWIEQGKANFILDNLIAGRRARPMIVVMENGMVAAKAGTTPAPGARGNEAFGELVVSDLIPAIDSSYRTLAERANRAIAGLSMGAGQAMQIGLSHLDLFAFVGAFSGGAFRNFDLQTSYDGVFRDSAAFNKRVQLLWMGAGTAEMSRMAGLQQAAESLRKAGVRLVWFEAQGTSHEWQTWRLSLHDFAPRLFEGR